MPSRYQPKTSVESPGVCRLAVLSFSCRMIPGYFNMNLVRHSSHAGKSQSNKCHFSKNTQPVRRCVSPRQRPGSSVLCSGKHVARRSVTVCGLSSYCARREAPGYQTPLKNRRPSYRYRRFTTHVAARSWWLERSCPPHLPPTVIRRVGRNYYSSGGQARSKLVCVSGFRVFYLLVVRPFVRRSSR